MDTGNTSGVLGVIIAAIALSITLIIERKSISTFFKNFSLVKESKYSPQKRRFLKVLSGLSVSGIIYYVQPCKIKNIYSIVFSKDNKLVRNIKTGKIHHKVICKDHLPHSKNTETVCLFNEYKDLHKHKKMTITKSLLNNLNDDDKEILLISAISDSPTSTHLYKFIIKLWGKQKRYSEIHKFLEINISYLNGLKKASVNYPKKFNKYSKAIAELQNRKIIAEYNANINLLRT